MESKYSRHYLIETGMGLQDVDGLKNSSYFIEQSKKYIRGEISLSELDDIITSYYKNNQNLDNGNKEADIVSQRISALLSDDSFSLSVSQLQSIHRYLFKDILPHPGELRKYNFKKEEWVLNGDSVTYGDYRDLDLEIMIHLNIESRFFYGGLTQDEIAEHLAWFVSTLWQKHPFEEGNTRTTVVFFIKYLRSLGFDVTNDLFAKNSWYFRNALVRSNYINVPKGIRNDDSYLVKCLHTLLFNEENSFSNKELIVTSIPLEKSSNKGNRILALIENNPKIKISEIASSLNISERTVKNLLHVLKNDGVISRAGGKKSGYWIISKKN